MIRPSILFTRRSVVLGIASISAGCGSATASTSGGLASTNATPATAPPPSSSPVSTGSASPAPSAPHGTLQGAPSRWPLDAWHSTAADFKDAWRDEFAGLRVSLRDTKRDANAPGFLATFVLANVGKKPIAVYQRWNSWGAYQWRFAIIDAAGREIVAGNPQEEWTRNGPTASLIEPGKELAGASAIRSDATQPFASDTETYVTGTDLTYPLRVRGIFESHPAEQPPEPRVGAGNKILTSRDLWAGAIATAWSSIG